MPSRSDALLSVFPETLSRVRTRSKSGTKGRCDPQSRLRASLGAASPKRDRDRSLGSRASSSRRARAAVFPFVAPFRRAS